jgi:hypothetical protein
MHNRQSGAAHVPMMFFLLLLVLFLGAVAFAFITNTKNGELVKQRNDAQAAEAELRTRELLVQHYIEDNGRVVGKQGKYEGRKGQGPIYKDATLTYSGVMNPEEIQKVMSDALTAAELAPASGLENTLSSLVTNIKQLKTRVKDVETELEKARTEKSEVDKKFQAATTEASAKAREFATNVEEQRTAYENAKVQKDTQIAQVSANLNTRSEELSAEKERAAAQEKLLRGEIEKFQRHNSALVAKDEMRRPPDAADGKVVVARNNVPTAFINLGRKDMLQPGTMFRVKNVGSSAVKGYATVTRVEEERSEVALSGFVDPIGDYAREGDLIYNDLYTPGVTRTIFLLGRFDRPYAKDDLANLLRRLGNRVVHKMAPGVDTVIIGSDPINEAQDGFTAVQESPDFKLASELRVEFAYLSTIRDLIKLN